MYIPISICIYTYLYICIYIERERGREREGVRESEREKEREVYTGTSAYTRCVYDLNLGNADICVSDFWGVFIDSLSAPPPLPYLSSSPSLSLFLPLSHSLTSGRSRRPCWYHKAAKADPFLVQSGGFDRSIYTSTFFGA